MKNITNLNFFTSVVSIGARCKSYVVALMLLTIGSANAQNGDFILNYSHENPVSSSPANDFNVSPFLGYHNYKQQYIYYPGEFATQENGLGIGLGAKEIKSLAFNVTQLTFAPAVKNFMNVRIRIGNYTAWGFSATASAAFGQQWTSTDSLDMIVGSKFTMEVPDFQITSLGWKTIDLVDDVTGNGFLWDGSSPILVEISNDTPIPSVLTAATDAWNWNKKHYSVEGTTYSSSTFRRSAGGLPYYHKDATFGTLGRDMWSAGTTASGTMTMAANGKVNDLAHRLFRPNIRFVMDCSYWTEGGATNLVSTVLPNDEGCKKLLLNVVGASRGYGLLYIWQRSVTPGFDEGTVETLANGNSETFVATQANVDYYYRRLTDCGGVRRPSTPWLFEKALVNTFNGATWSAGNAPDEYSDAMVTFTGGSYAFNANARGCGCSIGDGAHVEVNSGATFRIDRDLQIHTNGSLTIHSGAALLQGNPNAITTGVVNVRRTTQPMVMFDFTYYGSPVEGVLLNQFSPNTLSDKFFKWNIDIATSNWTVEPPTNVMARAQGYIIRAPQGWSSSTPTAFTGQFVGKPHNGTFTGNIKTGSTNMNMVVNPYPSPLDLKKFHKANETKLDGTYYFWTHNTPITGLQYSANDFAMFNGTGGTGTKATNAGANTTVPNGIVGVGQGFMVKGTGAATGLSTVTYTNEMRLPASANAQFFRAGSNADVDVNAQIDSRFWLNFSGSSSFKQILVGYVEGATEAYDNGFDGEISADANSFYSILNDHQLGIQGKGAFTSGDVVSLGFKVASAGTYKIDLDNFDGVFTSCDIFLKDKLTNITHNLKNGAYEFVTVPGTHNERFEIIYVNLSPVLGVASNGISETADMFVAFKQENDLVVNAGSAEIDMVQVFDLSGRMLAQQKGLNANNLIVSNPNWASQVLIVQMRTADKLVLTKKVVF